MSTLEAHNLGKRFPVRGSGLRREMLDALNSGLSLILAGWSHDRSGAPLE